MVMTSRGEHYSSRDQVPRAGTFDPATLIFKANEKRINQKELVDLIIRTGRLVLICVEYYSGRMNLIFLGAWDYHIPHERLKELTDRQYEIHLGGSHI